MPDVKRRPTDPVVGEGVGQGGVDVDLVVGHHQRQGGGDHQVAGGDDCHGVEGSARHRVP